MFVSMAQTYSSNPMAGDYDLYISDNCTYTSIGSNLSMLWTLLLL